MNTAPTEEDLLLYYYGEGLNPEERDEISALLQNDPSTAERYEQLRMFLHSVRDDPDSAASDRQHHVWHAAIDNARRARPSRNDGLSLHIPSFAWGIAAALLLAIGVAIGFGVRTPTPAGNPGAGDLQTAQQTYAREAAFARGLREYLRDSQLGVLEMDATSSEARQDLAWQIVRQNRLFERTAERYDADELARLLRAFEPVLLELGAPDTSDVRAERLKSQLDFELSVVLTKLAPANSTDTETI